MPGKKKKKKQDFQKVKLKVGRKLPRPTNETRAQLKVKSINIRGQFKPTTSGGDTLATGRQGKSIDIKELLKHCVHRSVGFRLNALTELCAALASPLNSTVLVSTHLGPLLGALGSLFADDDVKVRAEARKLLRLLAESGRVEPRDAAPFFPLLVAHLCCAMTHIHEDIRLDSLHVLDILLARFPSLVAGLAARLLPNFIGLIAQPRHVRADASGHKQAKASSSSTLIINPNSQMSTQKWRLRVLRRLGLFFGAIATETRRSNVNDVMVPVVVNVDENGRTDGPLWLITPGCVNNCVHSEFMLRPAVSDAQLSDSVSKVETWLHSLLPLLIDCWVEAGAATTARRRSELSTESLSLLHCIVSVLEPLFEYVTNGFEQSELLTDWLRTNYAKRFASHFMADFPYCSSSNCPSKKQKLESVVSYQDSTFTSVNLSLCLAMTYLLADGECRPKDESHQSAPATCWLTDVVDYVVQLLSGDTDDVLSSDQLQLIFTLVDRLMQLSVSEEVRSRLLCCCCEAASVVCRREPSSPTSKSWFNFLFKFIVRQQQTMTHAVGAEVDAWICGLPALLLVLGESSDDSVSDVLAAVLKAGSMQLPQFLRSFEQHLSKFLERSFLKRLGAELHARFIESFSWLGSIDAGRYRQLAERCVDGTFTPNVVRQLLGILEYRLLTHSGNTEAEEDQFILLMFTIALRSKQVDMKRVNDEYLEQVRGRCKRKQQRQLKACYIIHDDPCFDEMSKCWSDQKQLIEGVFEVMSMSVHRQRLVKLLAAYIEHVLTCYRVFRLITASSIVKTLVCLLNVEQDPAISSDATPARVGLLTGLCVTLDDVATAVDRHTAESSTSNDAEATLQLIQQSEEMQRRLAVIVAEFVRSCPPLVDSLRDLIVAGEGLKESTLAHLSTNIPGL